MRPSCRTSATPRVRCAEPLLGRDLEGVDDENAPPVAVINAAMARKYFTGNPVGRLFSFDLPNERPIRIVGVSGDTKYDRIRHEAPPTVYLPWPQQLVHSRAMNFQLRTSVPPESVMAGARRVVADIDPTLPIAEVTTQKRLIERMMWSERNFALLSVMFSSIAVLLACIGVYGVLAYAVARRTGEFGIRLALGATGGNIKWLVLRGTIVLILVATAIGIPATMAAARLIESMLYGVKPADPVTLLAASLAIAAAALIAAYIPSRRAARSDPAVALRYE